MRTTLVRVERWPGGPRVWVAGVRVHHWHVGGALVALGGWLIFDDRRDLPRRRPVPLAPVFDPEIGVTTSNAVDGVW